MQKKESKCCRGQISANEEKQGELNKEQNASCRQEKSDRMGASNIWQGSKIWQRIEGDCNSDIEMKTNTVALDKIEKISFSSTYWKFYNKTLKRSYGSALLGTGEVLIEIAFFFF